LFRSVPLKPFIPEINEPICFQSSKITLLNKLFLLVTILRYGLFTFARIMAKVKTSFFCQNCGAQSPKWVGKCGSCGEWNTYVEEVIDRPKSATPFSSSSSQRASKAHKLHEIEQKIERRIEL